MVMMLSLAFHTNNYGYIIMCMHVHVTNYVIACTDQVCNMSNCRVGVRNEYVCEK